MRCIPSPKGWCGGGVGGGGGFGGGCCVVVVWLHFPKPQKKKNPKKKQRERDFSSRPSGRARYITFVCTATPRRLHDRLTGSEGAFNRLMKGMIRARP